jgi:hypothetical protein
MEIDWKDPKNALTKLYPRILDEEDDEDAIDGGSFFNFFEHEKDVTDVRQPLLFHFSLLTERHITDWFHNCERDLPRSY